MIIPTQPSLATSNPDMALITRVSRGLAGLEEQLNQLYPERADLIRQLILGVATGEHVLLYGPPGTAKSQIVRDFFGAFKDATTWKKVFGPTTTPTSVFGAPNKSIYDRDSTIVRQTHGTVLEANLAFLDEFLDLPVAFARDEFLPLLNERQFTNGGKVCASPLLMAVATTNKDPHDLVAQKPEIHAVVDRFIFRAKVADLTGKEGNLTMIESFLSGNKLEYIILYQDMWRFWQLVRNYRLLNNPSIIQAYLEILMKLDEKRNANGKNISSRQYNQATQVVEAAALLNGRVEVDPDDLMALKYALYDSGPDSDIAEFDKLAKPIIEKCKAAQVSKVDQAEDDLIKLVTIEVAGLVVTPGASANKNVNTLQQLQSFRNQIVAIKPKTDTVKAAQMQLLQVTNKKIADGTQVILEKS